MRGTMWTSGSAKFLFLELNFGFVYKQSCPALSTLLGFNHSFPVLCPALPTLLGFNYTFPVLCPALSTLLGFNHSFQPPSCFLAPVLAPSSVPFLLLALYPVCSVLAQGLSERKGRVVLYGTCSYISFSEMEKNYLVVVEARSFDCRI